MQVRMVGIDHNSANVENRENFSFTLDEIRTGLKTLKGNKDITGSVIISTCNRTELWISQKEEKHFNVGKVFCEIARKNYDEFKEILIEREGKNAIEHLMLTACGINSRIFGEDQILSQIRDSLDIARDVGTNSSTLEKVFLNAITVGKKVKDSVRLTNHNPSVASSSIQELKGIYGSLKDKNCLIIGNGKMAVLVAEHLVKNGANVTMTMRRRYHNKESMNQVNLKNCNMISYDSRYKYLKDADIVISATLSPHYTLTVSEVEKIDVKEHSVWIDLAMPRDIQGKIGEKYNISLYDIDDIQSEELDDEINEKVEFAKQIIGDYRDDILKWMEFRKNVPAINKIIKLAKKDTVLRGEKDLKEIGIDERTIKSVNSIIAGASGRAMSKILFGLKETLSEELWDTVIFAMLQAAEKETLKR